MGAPGSIDYNIDFFGIALGPQTIGKNRALGALGPKQDAKATSQSGGPRPAPISKISRIKTSRIARRTLTRRGPKAWLIYTIITLYINGPPLAGLKVLVYYIITKQEYTEDLAANILSYLDLDDEV